MTGIFAPPNKRNRAIATGANKVKSLKETNT